MLDKSMIVTGKSPLSPRLVRWLRWSSASVIDDTDPVFSLYQAYCASLDFQRGYWLELLPVEFVADMRTLYCMGNVHLNISSAEKLALAPMIAECVHARGWQFFNTAERWLMHCDVCPDLTLPALAQMQEQALRHEWLPKTFWTFLTEVQLTWQSSSVNLSRVANKLPVINGIWCQHLNSASAYQIIEGHEHLKRKLTDVTLYDFANGMKHTLPWYKKYWLF